MMRNMMLVLMMALLLVLLRVKMAVFMTPLTMLVLMVMRLMSRWALAYVAKAVIVLYVIRSCTNRSLSARLCLMLFWAALRPVTDLGLGTVWQVAPLCFLKGTTSRLASPCKAATKAMCEQLPRCMKTPPVQTRRAGTWFSFALPKRAQGCILT